MEFHPFELLLQLVSKSTLRQLYELILQYVQGTLDLYLL